MVSVENGHANNAANKVEVGKMVRIDSGIWIDLKSVDVFARVEEEPVVRVEHLMAQQVEPFSGHPTVI